MSVLQIPTAEVFVPLLEPARYKGAHGGRGSGKSHFFSEMLVDDAVRFPGESGEGLRAICGREIQKSLKDSAKFLIESKLNKFNLGESDGFKVYNDCIKTPGDGLMVFQGLQDHTTESIKSFEGFHRFWGEESQTISSKSLQLIRPTIRWEDEERGLISELWFSWNPRRRLDAVDKMLRGASLPSDATVVQANWSDNPWFPGVLEQERRDCLIDDPDQYEHIWEGDYVTVVKGAYFSEHLKVARKEGRIGRYPRDPIQPVYLYCDIGGTGRRSDAFTIWAVQFIRKEIRVINYYEAVGQTYEDHLFWMRENNYMPGNSFIKLPHDGTTSDRVMPVTYESVFRAANYTVETLKNKGEGAAMARVSATRRLFKFMSFNEATCHDGISALGWYHEKIDEDRDIGLGPDHDWSSHAADSFGLMSVSYEEPSATAASLIPEETSDY